MTQREIAKKLSGFEKHARRRLESYFCQHCEHWHLTHSRDERYEAKTFPGIGRISIRRGYSD